MSTAELIKHLGSLDNTDRLRVIEAASQLIRNDLESRTRQEERLQKQAVAMKSLYQMGGELTEWTTLDGEEVLDESVPR